VLLHPTVSLSSNFRVVCFDALVHRAAVQGPNSIPVFEMSKNLTAETAVLSCTQRRESVHVRTYLPYSLTLLFGRRFEEEPTQEGVTELDATQTAALSLQLLPPAI